MSEIEASLEKTEEDIHHEAEHTREKWISRVALYSALVAAIAAVSAMLAGHHSDEAMITQIRASDQWSYYQAKGVKAAVLDANLKLLQQMGKDLAQENAKSVDGYKQEQKEISELAKEFEGESRQHLKLHSVLAKAVTCFQVAIAVAAISVLTRRRRYWYVSMAFSLVGLFFFCIGVLDGAMTICCENTPYQHKIEIHSSLTEQL